MDKNTVNFIIMNQIIKVVILKETVKIIVTDIEILKEKITKIIVI